MKRKLSMTLNGHYQYCR